MAFSDPISVNDNAAVAKSFPRQSFLGGGADYVESTATANAQRKISIRHTNAGKSIVSGGQPVRRHLLQVIDQKLNTTTGKWEKATMNVTLTVDPGASTTTTQLYDLRAFVVNLLTTTNVDKLLRDES